MKKTVIHQSILYILVMAAGILLGWMFFHSPPITGGKQEPSTGEVNTSIWTCAMHPQIKMEGPGKCPLCGMDLIPLNQGGKLDTDATAVHLTKESAQLANVLTSVVGRQNPVKEVRLYGKVQADERLLQNQVAHIAGRIEKLYVDFTGEPVQKGEKLAQLYSPDLVNAQQELLEAAKTKGLQPDIYEASKQKLRAWKLSETQISAIESSGNVQATVDVEATTSGIVTARRVNNGDYVSQGSVLYEVTNLSHVWVLFDAYESDLPFLKTGDHLDFKIQALPGASYSGVVRFIDPVIDPVARVAKVRVEMSNPGGKLKPEMFATGIVKSNLEAYRDKMIIPRSAVLWTGKRSIVYVKKAGSDEPVFNLREIETGPLLGDGYVVIDGLQEGEVIVTQGAFSVDAAAQLEGKPSMMNPVIDRPAPKGEKEVADVKKMKEKQFDETKQVAVMLMKQQLNVSGNCDRCKERIENAARSVKGVKGATWDSQTKLVDLIYDGNRTTPDEIARAIAAVGHDTEKYKATDKVYQSLPECCLYDRTK